MNELAVYHEVRVVDSRGVDRFFLAPAGLGLAQAKEQRRGRWYKTQDGARRGLVAALDSDRREARA